MLPISRECIGRQTAKLGRWRVRIYRSAATIHGLG
jgi:hypothetical protein